MLNIMTNNSKGCMTCAFTSFCIPEENNPKRIKPVSYIVKQHKQFKRKEFLCQAQDKFTSLYVIKKGVVKSFQVDSEGNELIRRFYFQGEILGYEAIGNGQHPYSTVALCDTLICEIPYENFLKFLIPQPNLLRHMLTLMSQQMTAGSYLEAHTAEQRLAAFIIDLSERLHCPQSLSELILPMSRQDIGNYLRLAAETVSRILSKLQKNKIIAINHKNLRILKPNKLIEIADVGI